MLTDDEVKAIHFEKGVEIVKKHFRRQIKEQRRKAFKTWTAYTESVYQTLLLEAAKTVQHAYRSHQSRSELASRIAERRIQIEREKEVIRLENEKIYHAATKIQKRARMNHAKSKLQLMRLRLSSAFKIQCAQRIHIANKKMKARKAYLLHRHNSATKIQSTWRAKEGRKYFRVLQKIKLVDVELVNKQQQKLKMKEMFEDAGGERAARRWQISESRPRPSKLNLTVPLLVFLLSVCSW